VIHNKKDPSSSTGPDSASDKVVTVSDLTLVVQGSGDLITVGIMAFVLSCGVSVGLYFLVQWLTWLFWPVIVLLGLFILGNIGVMVDHFRWRVVNADTGTSTIRGATQGDVEIKGQIKAIKGQELTSLVYELPCVRYKTSISQLGTGSIVGASFFSEQYCRALLLDDGTGEVFVPQFANSFDGQMLMKSVTLEKLTEQVKQHILANIDISNFKIPTGPFSITEYMMPVGATAQMNARFATIKASDSYTETWRRLANEPELPLPPDTLEQMESDWRSYADTFIQGSGNDSQPAPLLNVLIPSETDLSFTLKYCGEHSRSMTLEIVSISMLLSIPLLALAAILLGWLSPQQLWPW